MKNTFAERKDSIQLKPRDLEIFRFIQANGAKTSSELSSAFWNEKSRKAHAGFQRIRKLIEAGFLCHGDPRLLHLSDVAKALIAKKENASGVEGVKQDG